MQDRVMIRRIGETMGRVTVELELKNYEDMVLAKAGSLPEEHIRKARAAGIVDTGATRLVLPQSTAEQLGLTPDGDVKVRYADNRGGTRSLVRNVWLEFLDRGSVFSAIVEPNRQDALVGAIV